jgi:hypothetical protein
MVEAARDRAPTVVEAGMVDVNEPWIAVGPAPEDASGLGVAGGVSGRVWSIAISPDVDGQGTAAMLLGVNGGGVWRSVDFTSASPRWSPLTDHVPSAFPLARQQGLLNIGAIAVDPNNPRTVYAGSGDPAGPGANVYGTGILKSTDGGDSWSLLSVGSSSFAPGFTRIFVDPTSPSGNVVYATGAFGPNTPLRGIYRSDDGGSTWSLAQGGMPGGLAVTDLDYRVNGDRITLFAGVVDTTGSDSGANGVWQSGDGGRSWAQMFIVPLTDLGTGQPVPDSAIGLISLAVDRTPGFPNGAFAAITNATTSKLLNVFKLAGAAWQPSGTGLPPINVSSAQSIGISPEGSVYVGGVNNGQQNGLFQSTDGGASWVSIDVGSNGVRPHTDQHAWAFFGGAVYNGNDGGVYRFTPRPGHQPGPGTWESLNTASLQTILAQGIDLHPQYPNVMLVGSQDNGVALRTRGNWRYVTGGDAGPVRFDEQRGQFAWATGRSAPSFLDASMDGGQTWTDNSPQNQAIQDYAPIAPHPTQAGRVVVGVDRVFEWRQTAGAWTAISGALAGTSGFVTALVYGGDDTVYVAYGPQLFKTTNDGGDGGDANWPELNKGNDWHGGITSVAVDSHNSDRVYLATSGGAVWRSGDAGRTWTEITGDFPSPTLSINALAMRSDNAATEPTPFAASSVGVYARIQRANGPGWVRMSNGLPETTATDLRFNDTNKYLLAGTYGRGLFAAYLHFRTAVGPGATSLDNVVFNAAVDLDGRICLNQAEFGHAFSGWFEVQGDGRTDAPPAATAVRQSVFVFVKGLNQRIYLNQADFGHAFSGWFEVQGDGRTDAAPAAATLNNTLFVVMKGLNQRIYLNQADFGHAFSGWFELQGGGRTDVAPTAVTIDNSLFVFIKGLNGRIYLNQAEFGHAFSGWFEVGGGIA